MRQFLHLLLFACIPALYFCPAQPSVVQCQLHVQFSRHTAIPVSLQQLSTLLIFLLFSSPLLLHVNVITSPSIVPFLLFIPFLHVSFSRPSSLLCLMLPHSCSPSRFRPLTAPPVPYLAITSPTLPAPSQRVHKARSGRGASPKSKPDLIQCPACEGGAPPTSLSQRGGQQEKECDDDGEGKREQEQRVWLV